MKKIYLAFTAATVLSASVAHAQVNVTLPSTSQTTMLTATVSEQADVTVPSGVTFNVTDINASTASSTQSVSVSGIVLGTATKQLKISLQANAATFTQPSGTATWNASAVTWNAPTWTNATGASGTLSNATYNAVATCTADVTTCSTTALVLTLASNTSIVRSGNYTLTVTWKFESIGT